MNAIERKDHEIKLINMVEKYGFELSGIVPYMNYDEYVFVMKDKGDLLNLEISFNGQGYRLATGFNNYVFYQNNAFDFNWQQLKYHVKHFALGKELDTDNEWGGE